MKNVHVTKAHVGGWQFRPLTLHKGASKKSVWADMCKIAKRGLVQILPTYLPTYLPTQILPTLPPKNGKSMFMKPMITKNMDF